MPSAKSYLNFQKIKREHAVFKNQFSDGIDRLNDISKGLVPSTQEEFDNAQVVLKSLHEVAVNMERRNERREAKKLAKRSKVVRGGRP